MQPNPDSKPKSWFRGKRLALLITACLVLMIFVRFVLPVATVVYIAQPVRVEGHAMEPALNHGDRIFVIKRMGELKRGDIVIFLYPHDQSKSYLKRIIGLPGETIEIEAGRVLINGSQIEEPYLDPKYASHDTTVPVQIPAQHYFVMGDNRRNSSDSRYWGTVPRELIYGKFTRRYWPLG